MARNRFHEKPDIDPKSLETSQWPKVLTETFLYILRTFRLKIYLNVLKGESSP